MADKRRDLDRVPEPLNERELEILACLIEGLSNREISSRLYLAYRTVKWYNTQIYGKLGVSNRGDAIERAASLGLLQTEADTQQQEGKHNLPSQSTPFIGRHHELGELGKLLNDDNTRIVTILAPGGMGKTRLSIEVARTQIRRYDDGVYFIPLAPLSSPNDIVTTIAENIGFVFNGEISPSLQLVNFLKGRRMLLVLDNFEHLLEGAELVSDIIQSTSGIKAIVTSRERLNLRGENGYSLHGLEFPTWETAEDAMEYDAVKLFMQSAHRVRSDFELHPDDLDFMARICHLTAGMPLGIELAAGWVDVLSLEKIADEIQRGIDILETNMRDVPERHRSLRATFEQTWNRLTEDEQTVFTQLSVFRSGFTLPSAEAVVSANVRHLRKLAQKALIQIEINDRYAIHELLRQYAEEQLIRMGDLDSRRQLHSTYYLNFLAKRDEDVRGRRQFEALQEIRTDFENIRLAWLWSSDHQQVDEIYSALNCLTNAFEMNNQLLEGQRLLFQAKSKFQRKGGEPPHPVWDAVSVRLERYNFLIGHLPDDELVEKILERNRIRDDKIEMAWCHWVLGDYYSARHDVENRNVHFEAFREIHTQVGNEFYMAHGLIGTGLGFLSQNQSERALDAFRKSASIRRRIGDGNSLPFSLYCVAMTLIDSGRFAEGETHLDEALAVESQVGHTPILGSCYSLKANLAFWRADFELAHQHTDVALSTIHHQTFIGSRGLAMANLSNLLLIEGHYQQSFKLAEESRTHVIIPLNRRWTEWTYALVNCELGNDATARSALRNVLQIAINHSSSQTDLQLCLPLASVLFARAGKTRRAVELLGLAHSAPDDLTGWMSHWKLFVNLQNDLKSELGLEEFSAVWEHGTKLDLGLVITELLKELEDN